MKPGRLPPVRRAKPRAWQIARKRYAAPETRQTHIWPLHREICLVCGRTAHEVIDGSLTLKCNPTPVAEWERILMSTQEPITLKERVDGRD